MKKIFTLHDRIAQIYTPPFFVNTDEEAARILSYMLADELHEITTHAKDYDVFCVGTFDFNSGVITSHRRNLGSLEDITTLLDVGE